VTLFAFGINHKTAPVEIREKVAFAPEKLQDALKELSHTANIHEVAIVSTCNRTELYYGSESADSQPIIDWFRQYHHLDADDVDPYIYTHSDNQAVQHILRVASGLDSLVLGEPQILGQIKDAYTIASEALVAKQVRTDTAIGASPVSVAFAAVNLAKQIFADLSEHTALLIGAGDTVELVACHLNDQKI